MGEKARCVVALLPVAPTHSPLCFLVCPARSQRSAVEPEMGRANLQRGEEGGDVQGQQKGRRIVDFGL